MMNVDNRLQKAAKYSDEDIQRGLTAIIQSVKDLYAKPVLVTVLISLEDGDLFDFVEVGDHEPDGIQWIGNAMDFHRRFEICQSLRSQPEDGPVVRPEGISPENWEQIPTEMQRLVSAAAKAGKLTIMQGDGQPNPLAPSGGSAEPLADGAEAPKTGLDEQE